ncbi:MAG TPA: class E sortase [Actinomycetota bacterium]|nr:class E sortase [Actinomycetota bacterium]
MRLSRPTAKTIRRSLTALAIVFALGGTALIAYPFATDLWAERIQNGLTVEFAASARAYESRSIEVGKPLTRLEIPKLDVDVIVVEGTTQAALHAGAGHYPETPLPGEAGNVAIAGHRTSYGRPFNRMDELEPGDEIILTTPIGKHTYEVIADPWVVDPENWAPIYDYKKSGSFLTLTSCHPEGSAAYRIIVRAELVESSDTLAMRGSA